MRTVLLHAQSDERLVALVREGSEAAFNELVRRVRSELVMLAAAFAPPAEVEDAVQEGLIRAWRALRVSEGEMDVRPWLKTIVRIRALTARSKTRYTDELDEQVDGVRQPAEIVITADELDRAVTALPFWGGAFLS